MTSMDAAPNWPMRIAVLADTHNRLPASVTSAIANADAIWHLGDVCSPEIIECLKTLGPAVRVVRGNCDCWDQWPLEARFELAGLRFLLIHIPPRTVPAEVDVVLHGHTHVPRNEVLQSTHFLNPGCITRPNRGAPRSFAWLQLAPGQPLQWQLETF